MLKSVLLFLSAAATGVLAQGNTTCKTNSLDWYTQSVGETPCRTYERLRQSCDSRYRVGNFPLNIPPDVCNTQVSGCCCNSVAWALSMLCLNCQWGYGSGGDDTGLDALQASIAGGYQAYLSGCTPVSNQKLTNDTQNVVCKQNINIPNYVYTLFWPDGKWFYEFTRQTASLQIQSGQNGSHCAAPPTSSMISATGNPTPTSTSPIPSSDNSPSTNVGAIIGGVVGGVGLILIAALVFWFSRRRRSREIVDLTEDERPQAQEMVFEPYIDRPTTDPSSSGQPLSSIPGSSTGYAQTRISSDDASTAYVPSSRPTKVGMVESSVPNREENRPMMLGADMNDRHEDSAELTEASGLGRSASGRLPPSYQER